MKSDGKDAAFSEFYFLKVIMDTVRLSRKFGFSCFTYILESKNKNVG